MWWSVLVLQVVWEIRISITSHGRTPCYVLQLVHYSKQAVLLWWFRGKDKLVLTGFAWTVQLPYHCQCSVWLCLSLVFMASHPRICRLWYQCDRVGPEMKCCCQSSYGNVHSLHPLVEECTIKLDVCTIKSVSSQYKVTSISFFALGSLLTHAAPSNNTTATNSIYFPL